MADGSPLAHSPTLTATAPGEDDTRLAAGVQVGEYVIERFIGAGAMGEVYAGAHPVIGKRVAIKVLRHDLAASAEAAERFIREARAVNQIEHENVVDVFAFGRLDDGRLYLVMDLVEGKSLRAALVDGPLELGKALAVLGVIANALDAAHARGVVHRDLKPDNIVLASATAKVFVLDFGIAKLISTANAAQASAPGTLTGQGTWLGTPGYMAPEQWSIDGAGPASDRYALGVIAFELLSGALPFSASSVPGMMEQHFRAEVPTLASRGAVGLPTALDAVLRRALAKDPDARYPSARALVDALHAAAGTSARSAGAAAAGTPRRLWWPALAGGTVLAIAVVVVILSRDETTHRIVIQPVDEPAHEGIAIDVTSSPPGAEIRVAGRVHGATPARIVGSRGETLDLRITKPGYLALQDTITVAEARRLEVRLVAVDRFKGTWRLANGELRKLERNGDQVDVYKVATARGGEPAFFKHYAFVPAENGVAFASDDEIVDPRAPNDPRCHVPVHVEYRYDPERDVLEQHRDKVKISFHDGSCVVQSREVEPTTLARVDAPVDEVEIPAPVGVVKPVPTPPRKTVDAKQKAPVQQSVAPAAKKNVGKMPPASYTKPEAQKQILPQPQAPAPSLDAEDSAQQLRQKK